MSQIKGNTQFYRRVKNDLKNGYRLFFDKYIQFDIIFWGLIGLERDDFNT